MHSPSNLLRRRHISFAIAAAIPATLIGRTSSALGRSTASADQKYTMDLCPGRIGVSVSQLEAIQLAKKYGFGSVEPMVWFINSPAGESANLPALLSEQGLVWGAGGLSVEFRKDEQVFREGIQKLRSEAEALNRAGVTRVGTWLRPSHAELTYLQNFRQHAKRLREVAKILADSNIRFGLEYVGPFTSWTAAAHPFIHTMAETLELIDKIGGDNVGLVLDSWHWYCAAESAADIKQLRARDVVAVDLNDAPKGRTLRTQIDNQRELPAATGVIDIRDFLLALQSIGYDGPVRAEPFNKKLNQMDNEPAVKATAAAIQAAFELAK